MARLGRVGEPHRRAPSIQDCAKDRSAEFERGHGASHRKSEKCPKKPLVHTSMRTHACMCICIHLHVFARGVSQHLGGGVSPLSRQCPGNPTQTIRHCRGLHASQTALSGRIRLRPQRGIEPPLPLREHEPIHRGVKALEPDRARDVVQARTAADVNAQRRLEREWLWIDHGVSPKESDTSAIARKPERNIWL